MIEAYFLHVHPILPVVEADVLSRHHRDGQLQSYDVGLLWSLFFVAVNVGSNTVDLVVELIGRSSSFPLASARKKVSHLGGP